MKFQSPVRSRILLMVAAVGLSDMVRVYQTLGIGDVSALYAVNHWEREGVIRTRQMGRHRMVALNPGFPASTQLRALLEALVRESDAIMEFAEIIRPQVEEILSL
jgi:hypothetical protein